MASRRTPQNPARHAATRPPRRRRAWWQLRRLLFVLALLLVVAGTGFVYVLWQVPLPDEDPELTQTTFVCAANVSSSCGADNSIAQLSGGVDRVQVGYEQIPAVMVVALLSAEDRDFFRHSGVDPFGVGRALVSDLRNDGLRQGGSTITQQYVKNAYLTSDRTWERKVKEAVLAVKLERELPKQEILERYMNIIYFGRGAYGIEAASRVYFGKHVDELGLPEAAYLAGIIRAPEAADANRQPDDPLFAEQQEAARIRRQAVLDAMVEEGYISVDQRDAVDELDFSYVRTRTEADSYGTIARPELGTEYWVDFTRRWLVDNGHFTDAQIYGGGLRIYTTLDFDAQEDAVEAVESNLGWDDDPEAALVSIDAKGYIRAMFGGADYDASQVNLATGRLGGGTGRQPGSAFKPIVLAEALKQGMPLETTYQAPAKITIDEADAGEDWEVANYSESSQGTLNLVDATRVSSNTAYAQLMIDVGPAPVASLATRMGISTEVPAFPSIVLGTPEVSVLDMTTVYSTFANSGERVGPYPVVRVTDADGAVLWEAPGERDRVLSEEVADSVNWVLRQVVDSGTAKAAQLDQPVAGKTGTTDDYRDAWFVGYTCQMTTAVWVGYAGVDDTEPRYMTSVHGRKVAGGTFPAEIWHDYMVEQVDGLEPCEFDRPSTVPSGLERGRSSDTTSRSSGTAAPTTAAPTTSTTEDPDSTTTTAPPSSTTTVPPSSTTTAPPPTSTTSTSTTTQSTTTTTTTPSSTTSAPPP